MLDQKSLWDKEYEENKGKWRKETVSLPSLLKDKRVLELGVGNAKTLKAILRQKPKEVVAVDFSTNAITEAEKAISAKNVTFFLDTITSLPFQAGAFDVIVCYYVLNNLIERERKEAIKEMKRVLAPKGKILFEDFAVGDFRETEKKNKNVEEHTTENKKGLICHFFSENEVASLFKDFSRIRTLEKVSTPVIHKKNLQRRILSAEVSK